MKRRASSTTFCATSVVERMVVTHFLNPVDGLASETNNRGGSIDVFESSTRCRTSDSSNQNKHVIFTSQ